jgi:hypothetical protein
MALPNAGNDSQSYSRARRLDGNRPLPQRPPRLPPGRPLADLKSFSRRKISSISFSLSLTVKFTMLGRFQTTTAKSLILFMLPDATVKKLIVCFIVR